MLLPLDMAQRTRKQEQMTLHQEGNGETPVDATASPQLTRKPKL